MPDDNESLIHAVEAIQIPVPDLDLGLAFYRDKLGHELIWREGHSARLRMPDNEAELLLVTARP